MRNIFLAVLFIGLVAAAFTFFVTSDSNGLWGDTKTVKSDKDTKVSSVTIPTS